MPLNVACEVGYNEVASSMAKKRKSVHPNIPKTVLEYGEYLAGDLGGRFSHTIRGTQFFRGCLIGDGDVGTSVVFASPHFLEKVQCARELHIDGTFKVTPRAPKCFQLVTIMTVHYNQVSAVYGFCNIYYLQLL